MMDAGASRQVTVMNPNGIHVRSADQFARLARSFASTVQVIKDGQPVDGKSTLEILMLAAAPGASLTILANGGDAHEAVDALAKIIEAADDEDTTVGTGDRKKGI
jgi:phosphocarrier protein